MKREYEDKEKGWEMRPIDWIGLVAGFALAFVPVFFDLYSYWGALGICVGMILSGFVINWLMPDFSRRKGNKERKKACNYLQIEHD